MIDLRTRVVHGCEDQIAGLGDILARISVSEPDLHGGRGFAYAPTIALDPDCIFAVVDAKRACDDGGNC